VLTPPEVLLRLAHDESENVRERLALNRALSPEIIGILLRDESPEVLRSVFRYIALPQHIRNKYLRSKKWYRRYGASGWWDLPLLGAERLRHDKDPRVRQAIMSDYYWRRFVVEAVMGKPTEAITKEEVEALIWVCWEARPYFKVMHHPDPQVRKMLTDWVYHIPVGVVEFLCDDSDPEVSRLARERLVQRKKDAESDGNGV
jgi:hypothetical protein